jgi:ubiquitin carboxyl-terminal hydrolase 25/28
VKLSHLCLYGTRLSPPAFRLFYGKIRQRLAAVSLDNKSRPSVHEKEDLFSNLPVNVAEDGFDLYDGLSGYFDDIVEFEGKKARMEVSLVELPPLLQVQLQVTVHTMSLSFF